MWSPGTALKVVKLGGKHPPALMYFLRAVLCFVYLDTAMALVLRGCSVVLVLTVFIGNNESQQI